LNTGLEDGRTKNSAHVNNCGEGSGKGELEKPLGDPSEMGNKRSEEEEGERKLQVEEEDLVSGVWKMRGEIEEEENERERMKCAIEKEERAMVSEETMRKALARQVEEKEMMQGILAEMEKMEAAAERRRKGESQRHDEEMSLLRKIIAENVYTLTEDEKRQRGLQCQQCIPLQYDTEKTSALTSSPPAPDSFSLSFSCDAEEGTTEGFLREQGTPVFFIFPWRGAVGIGSDMGFVPR